MLLHYIIGPAVGALIGYCTNAIAVKMLFYPRKEVYLWGHKLPFTPGAIPKGKDRLAKAVGTIVSSSLVTQEDITSQLLNGDLENSIADKLCGVFKQQIDECALKFIKSEEKLLELHNGMVDYLNDEVMDGIYHMDIRTTIEEQGKRIIMEKTQGTMLSMFVNEQMIDSMIGPIGWEISSYIYENAGSYIKPEINEKLLELEAKTPLELIEKAGIGETEIKELIKGVYRDTVLKSMSGVMQTVDIAGIVQQKIEDMDVETLEKMVLSVMKNELDTIVNLGAVLGCLLGVITTFF